MKTFCYVMIMHIYRKIQATNLAYLSMWIGNLSVTSRYSPYERTFKMCSHRMRQRHVFCIWMSKQFRTWLFLCYRSHQQRNNIIGLAARYKIRYCFYLEYMSLGIKQYQPIAMHLSASSMVILSRAVYQCIHLVMWWCIFTIRYERQRLV